VQLNKIKTYDDGSQNGWILPIFKKYDIFFDDYDIKFIYALCIAPCSSKGPHLHYKRQCMLLPISGKVNLIQRINNCYTTTELDANKPEICKIPTGIAFKLINNTDNEVILLNLADHAWAQEDQDVNHPMDWSY